MPRANPARKAAKTSAPQGAKAKTSSPRNSNQLRQQVSSQVKNPVGKPAPVSSSAGPDGDDTDDDRVSPPVTRGSKVLARQPPSNLKRSAQAMQSSKTAALSYSRPSSDLPDPSSDDSSDGQVPEDCGSTPAVRFEKGTKGPPTRSSGDVAQGASLKRPASVLQSSQPAHSSHVRPRTEMIDLTPTKPPGVSAHGASLCAPTPPRRSPRKHYIVIYAKALEAFPLHQHHLSLYESWPEERKSKEWNKCRKAGSVNTDEADTLFSLLQGVSQ